MWEQSAVKLCHPLFRTPRAVKRLANTYCLIRAGVEAKDWTSFVGSSVIQNAGYRTPLLMLAVAAAYPGLAKRWLDGLVANGGWYHKNDSKQPIEPTPKQLESGDWENLAASLKLMDADNFAPFSIQQVEYWLPRVKRYSF
jgi:hypothetical protein